MQSKQLVTLGQWGQAYPKDLVKNLHEAMEMKKCNKLYYCLYSVSCLTVVILISVIPEQKRSSTV